MARRQRKRSATCATPSQRGSRLRSRWAAPSRLRAPNSLSLSPTTASQENAMNATLEAAKDKLERRFDIGFGPEPSLWEMAIHYYTSHGIEADEARKHADAVCTKTAEAIVG